MSFLKKTFAVAPAAWSETRDVESFGSKTEGVIMSSGEWGGVWCPRRRPEGSM